MGLRRADILVVDMQLRSVDLTNFIYVTDASMQYIGRITTYVSCDTDAQIDYVAFSFC